MLTARSGHDRLPESFGAHNSSHDGPAVQAVVALLSSRPFDWAAGSLAAQELQRPGTLVVAPPACREHRTAPEPLTRGAEDIPPENVRRLHVLTDPGSSRKCPDHGWALHTLKVHVKCQP